MSPRTRRRPQPDSLPLREELETLARVYHHLHNEVEQRKPGSGVRRDLEDQLLRVRERIDRILEEWIPDDELRTQWNEYLHTHGTEPDGPPAIDPLVFHGVSAGSGSVVDVRGRGDELHVWVDGGLMERVAADKDFNSHVPGLTFRVDGFDFDETFDAAPQALRSLADFVAEVAGPPGAPPPWEFAPDLLADGLIDVHFGLTPRGRRALASTA